MPFFQSSSLTLSTFPFSLLPQNKQKETPEQDKKKSNDGAEEEEEDDLKTPSILADEIEFGQKLSKDGTLFSGSCRGKAVMIKKVDKKLSKEEMREFKREVAIMSNSRHPNISKFPTQLKSNQFNSIQMKLSLFICPLRASFSLSVIAFLDCDWVLLLI